MKRIFLTLIAKGEEQKTIESFKKALHLKGKTENPSNWYDFEK